MDIDKNFINGLGIPPDAPKTGKSKMSNIDIDVPDNSSVSSSKVVAETPEDAITAMASNPIITNETSAAFDKESPTTDEKVDSVTQNVASNRSMVNNEDVTILLNEVKKISAVVSTVSEQVVNIQSGITRFSGYEVAVETLKRSLSVHQHNEDNLYKELEGYKKNQYYNYIRPFFEFLINLLTDMIASKKQYENDKDEFIEHHGQEIYDEIIELHNYYIQQIESQLQIQGVEIIEYSPNTPFISMEQIISTPMLTADNSLVGLVALADSACYKFEDKIIKKAKVHVYKAKPAENK